MTTLEAKMNNMNLDELAIVVATLAKDYSDAATMVFEAGLTLLEAKMDAEAFSRFCQKL